MCNDQQPSSSGEIGGLVKQSGDDHHYHVRQEKGGVYLGANPYNPQAHISVPVSSYGHVSPRINSYSLYSGRGQGHSAQSKLAQFPSSEMDPSYDHSQNRYGSESSSQPYVNRSTKSDYYSSTTASQQRQGDKPPTVPSRYSKPAMSQNPNVPPRISSSANALNGRPSVPQRLNQHEKANLNNSARNRY